MVVFALAPGGDLSRGGFGTIPREGRDWTCGTGPFSTAGSSLIVVFIGAEASAGK